MGTAERRGKFQTHPLLSGLWEDCTWPVKRAKMGRWKEEASFAASSFMEDFLLFGSISDLLETWIWTRAMEYGKEMWA